MKQLNLIGKFIFADIKHFFLPIKFIKLNLINKKESDFAAILNEIASRFSGRSASINQLGFANPVETFTKFIFAKIYYEASYKGFSLTFHERNTESRLPESQKRENNFLNYGLLIKAASAASITRASATSLTVCWRCR